MTTYERRARWIRRMQDRAERRRERAWLRHARAGLEDWPAQPRSWGGRRAA